MKKHPLLKVLLIMLAISVGIVMLVFFLIKIYSRQGKEFELPNMVGCNIEDMRADPTIDLTYIVIDSVYEEGDEGGRILTQDPKGGTQVKKGRKIYVTITSFSAAKCYLPDLCDLSVRQAVSQLVSVGLQPGRLRFVESPDRNAVLSLSQEGRILTAGQEMTHGTRVDMTVGLGPDGGYAIIPFVIGKTSREARRDLLSSSLNVGEEIYDAGTNRADAVVYRQEPTYTGVSQYPLGTEVTLYYRNATDKEIEKMVRNFKVDSSAIIPPPMAEEAADDDFEKYMEW